MTTWIKFEPGMQEPRHGDIVRVPKGARMIHYGKRGYQSEDRPAGTPHKIVVLRVIPGESVLTTTGVGVIKEIAITEILIDKSKT